MMWLVDRLLHVDESDFQQQQRPVSDINTTPGDGFNLTTDLLTGDNQPPTSDDIDKKPGLVPLVVNNTSAVDPLIVHAGAVVSMLHLLPSIACQQQPQVISTYLLTLSK